MQLKNHVFELLSSMPRFYSINFYQNRCEIKLILPKKNKLFERWGLRRQIPAPPTAGGSALRTLNQPFQLQVSGSPTGLMESARAAGPQIRVSKAPADVRHDGVGYFLESTTQGRCKVCQKTTRITCLKCNVRLHRSNAAVR